MKLFHGQINGNQAEIFDEEQHHILKVLRMSEGETIFVTDGEGTRAEGRLIIEGKKVLLDVVDIQQNLPAFSPRLHIAIAPTKNIDRTDFFVEKATEMGISEITFLHTEKSERKHLNIDKIRKKAIAASKQSLRCHFPIINDMVKWSQFLPTIHPDHTFVAHCDRAFQRCAIQELPLQDQYTFLIGPEGDFSPKEIEALLEQNIRSVQLGSQRLRTETAGVYIAAWNYFRM
ncbi:RsmE family RNA methyltransferase [Riemerella columbina]|uniref:RsmE family RNA methyltransferase n=1 Tax=Riemerella columbina TaxID=103810 RepID=UPI00037D63E7|nr:RsmE family RNA methyltransferase [Riemerella columbina]